MAKKQRHTPEQIIAKLREAEVLIAQGKTVAQASKQIGTTEQTYYRWRKEYGGLKTDQAKRLKDLEKENVRLKRLLADAELDKAILKECERRRERATPDGMADRAAEKCRALGLTHRLVPTMDADWPTTVGPGSEAQGCTPTWRTGPRSAVASSSTA
jgi:putative transposase